jgi:hypothetical protein
MITCMWQLEQVALRQNGGPGGVQTCCNSMVKRSRGRSSFVVPRQWKLPLADAKWEPTASRFGLVDRKHRVLEVCGARVRANRQIGVVPNRFLPPSCSVTRCVWLPEVQSEAQRHAVSWLGLAGRPVNSQTTRHNKEAPCSAEPAVRRLGPADRPKIVEPVATPRPCILCTRGRKPPDFVDLQVDRQLVLEGRVFVNADDVGRSEEDFHRKRQIKTGLKSSPPFRAGGLPL